MTIWELNNKNYTVDICNGTKVYTIHDFYKYPDKIVDFISDYKPHYHKADVKPSFNGGPFHDMKHNIKVDDLKEVVNFLQSICKQQPKFDEWVCTNCFKLVDKKFNNYRDNYWWPHIDHGYTCLIYLNKFSYPGTNLYSPVIEPNYNQIEHYVPWQSKKNWVLKKNLTAEYNKLVLFDGLNNPHGMDISSDLFYDYMRLNQVFFFEQ